MQNLVKIAVKNKSGVIFCFKIFYWGLVFLFAFAAYSTWVGNQFVSLFYTLAINAGRVALVSFSLTALPGIFGRFNLRFFLTTILMLFRRHLGITSFLLAVFHGWILVFIPNFASGNPSFSFPLFVTLGIIAYMLAFPLFLTSNDWSVRKLGKLWKWLHRLMYIILWLLFGHVALQHLSIWTVIIGTIAVLELLSFLYVFTLGRVKKAASEVNTLNK